MCYFILVKCLIDTVDYEHHEEVPKTVVFETNNNDNNINDSNALKGAI